MKYSVIIISLALGACTAPRSTGPPDPETLPIAAAGTGWDATYYPSSAQPHAAIVLLPMPGAERDTWEAFARHAQRQGYASLAVDLLPRNADTASAHSTREFTKEGWGTIFDLVRAAKNTVLARGADPDNIAIAGAGVTANLVLQYTQTDTGIQAVIMLSPGLDYQGLAIHETIRAIDRRPVFIAVAEGDAYAHSSSLQLHDWAQGYTELRVYDGAAHGTDLFATRANVTENILRWLEPILVPQPH